MSASRPDVGEPPRRASAPARLSRAWRELPSERRLAALAAMGLFVTLFLPWYQETVIATGVTSLRSISATLTGWGAFSFVEAAVLLVAAGVLTLLFVRAEGHAFHVPGGDGGVITAAGAWTCVLIVWRMFDRQGTTGYGHYATTFGIDWGIFIALGIAVLLAYSGTRIRQAHRPEPALPGEPGSQETPPRRRGSGKVAAARRRADAVRAEETTGRPARAPDMGAEDTWTQELPTSTSAPSPASGAAGRRRVRPRSVAAPAPEVTADSLPAPAAGTDAPAASNSKTTAPAGAPRRPAGLDPREIQKLDIAEPPNARIGTRRPAPPEPEDQPTIRLDRRS